MAKHNRRRTTYRLKPASLGVAALLVLTVAPWVLYCLVNLCNEQVAAQIRTLEHEGAAQEETLRRHMVEWNRMTEPQRVDEALKQNGLKFAFAPPERSVRVSANGVVQMPQALRASLEAERLAKVSGGTSGTVAQTSTGVRRGTRVTRN